MSSAEIKKLVIEKIEGIEDKALLQNILSVLSSQKLEFKQNQNYLQDQLENLKNGKEEFVAHDELDKLLSHSIKKHEAPLH